MVALVAWAALVLSVVATVYAWKLQQELGVARIRLDRYNRSLFNADDAIRRLQEELAETKASLHVEIMRRTGASSVHADMTMREIRLIHPQADEVLAGFHIGGCSSCAVEPDETLSAACAHSGTDVQTVVRNLNMLLGIDNPAAGGAPTPVKLPNMHLEL